MRPGPKNELRAIWDATYTQACATGVPTEEAKDRADAAVAALAPPSNVPQSRHATDPELTPAQVKQQEARRAQQREKTLNVLNDAFGGRRAQRRRKSKITDGW